MNLAGPDGDVLRRLEENAGDRGWNVPAACDGIQLFEVAFLEGLGVRVGVRVGEEVSVNREDILLLSEGRQGLQESRIGEASGAARGLEVREQAHEAKIELSPQDLRRACRRNWGNDGRGLGRDLWGVFLWSAGLPQEGGRRAGEPSAEALEVRDERSVGLVPPVRRLGKVQVDQLEEILRTVRTERDQGRRVFVGMLPEPLRVVAPLEREIEDRTSGQEDVDRSSQAVNVGAKVALLELTALGREVGQGSDDDFPVLGEVAEGVDLAGLASDLGEAEVADLVAELVSEHVLGLHVAMLDALEVGRLQTLGDREVDIDDGSDGKRAVASEAVGEVFLEELHHEIVEVLVLALVVDPDDVRVDELAEALGFAEEPLEGLVA